MHIIFHFVCKNAKNPLNCGFVKNDDDAYVDWHKSGSLEERSWILVNSRPPTDEKNRRRHPPRWRRCLSSRWRYRLAQLKEFVFSNTKMLLIIDVTTTTTGGAGEQKEIHILWICFQQGLLMIGWRPSKKWVC